MPESGAGSEGSRSPRADVLQANVDAARDDGADHGPTVPDGAALAGPQLVRLLDDLNTARLPAWAWPLPGGVRRWDRIVHEATGGRGWPRG